MNVDVDVEVEKYIEQRVGTRSDQDAHFVCYNIVLYGSSMVVRTVWFDVLTREIVSMKGLEWEYIMQ